MVRFLDLIVAPRYFPSFKNYLMKLIVNPICTNGGAGTGLAGGARGATAPPPILAAISKPAPPIFWDWGGGAKSPQNLAPKAPFYKILANFSKNTLTKNVFFVNFSKNFRLRRGLFLYLSLSFCEAL